MQIHWPLVVSTACQRAGLGLFVCAWLANLVFGAGLPMPVVALVSLAFLVVGGCASVFHLQRPQRFFNAFSNPKSHLTQEGVVTPFLGVALLLCGLNGIVWNLGGATAAVEVVTVLLACAFLVVTGLAYQMNSRPAWNTPLVLVLFLLTALAAGSVGAAAMGYAYASPALRVLCLVAALCVVAMIVAQAVYIQRMRSVGYGVAVNLSGGEYRNTYLAWLLCALGAALCALAGLVGVAALSWIGWALVIVSIAAWTVLFFKGALKVKMFPMYAVDLNTDM